MTDRPPGRSATERSRELVPRGRGPRYSPRRPMAAASPGHGGHHRRTARPRL